MVTATARIIHKGSSIHLWEIRITDENESLISICKLTTMVLPKRKISSIPEEGIKVEPTKQ
jgi:acyl-coenzyme A thioesterase PaaI-like protein